jgi:hypothetical protein
MPVEQACRRHEPDGVGRTVELRHLPTQPGRRPRFGQDRMAEDYYNVLLSVDPGRTRIRRVGTRGASGADSAHRNCGVTRLNRPMGSTTVRRGGVWREATRGFIQIIETEIMAMVFRSLDVRSHQEM